MPTKPTPIVVLHQAQIGENIGMSARAMANCGLYELRLSSARDNWDVQKAEAAAAHGQYVVDQHQEFSRLKEALNDVHHVYATTARRRNMPVRVVTPEQAAREIRALPEDQKACFLFGAEASGLSNDDISLASAVIEIPLNPECSSLNLSQAVLLCGYAWWSFNNPEILDQLPPSANKQDTEYFLERLFTALDQKGFFSEPELAVVMKRNIRTMVHRFGFRTQELQTWHGILSALLRSDEGK